MALQTLSDPQGTVVGVDVNDQLLATATDHARGRPNLAFDRGDATALSYRDAFDVVTAARVLQWLPNPIEALRGMIAALKAGGQLIGLDYNHLKARWHPQPPVAFRRFYDAFLAWRAEVGMDNEIADRLAGAMSELGLSHVRISDQHEVTSRSDADFETRISCGQG